MKQAFHTFILVAAAGAITALAGCDLPSTVWTKPGVSREEFVGDDAACNDEVKEANFGVGAAAGPNKRAFYDKCMEGLGYHKQGEKERFHLHNPDGVLEPSS